MPIPSLPERQDIQRICDRFNIPLHLIEELLQLEDHYRTHLKRRGIFDEIRRILQIHFAPAATNGGQP